MKQKIYLDNNATTALDPAVLEAMQAELSLNLPSNPSSTHYFGQEAKNKLIRARLAIANVFKVKSHELLFTSGGTEALNTILRSIPEGEIITSDIEHSAIYRTLEELKSKGLTITYLPAGLKGYISPEQLENALSSRTSLIVLSAVNGETGVKTDIHSMAQIALRHCIPFLVDYVALLGKEEFTIPEGVTAGAFSAHKFHGPKGVGLLYLKNHFKLTPLLTGGPQEYQRRAGTENLLGILGFAKAISRLSEELPFATYHMQNLRDQFESELKTLIPEIQINGEGPRICNTSNIAFPGVDAETLLMQLDLAGIAASHGSACSAGALEPSRILLNMGLPRLLARSSLRFSLSRLTTTSDIMHTLNILASLIKEMKTVS